MLVRFMSIQAREVKMKIIEKIFDAQTGKETILEREETIDEKNDREKREKEIAEIEIENANKQNAKAILLEKLGITEDEAKLLLS